MKQSITHKTKRSQYWSFILYEDSVRSDYIEYLRNEQVAFALSPWHDRDTWSNKDEQENPQHIAGTLKKKHRHGILIFSSLKSYEQAKEITDIIQALPPQRTNDINRSVQYFIHKNDPEKYQYEKKDIVSYAVNIDDFFLASPTIAEKKQYLAEMVEWCKKNNITRMNDLIDEALVNREDSWALLFNESPRWAIEKYVNGLWQKKEKTMVVPKIGSININDLAEEVDP